MGEVYSARIPSSTRDAAIKVLPETSQACRQHGPLSSGTGRFEPRCLTKRRDAPLPNGNFR